ncbi:putative addiction module antidote [Ekhidna lutea]|uniref:Putative addiction module antidote n=1 Tax=Ekhidna lutea TaxID=447679 RepID=A0A239KRJ1_EKHLU|nr:AbrB/MazE/SpoVT family DNA-binding domain-containing protein [Ekhidna lutea]SNT20139.1 putative addiction module antidote [Ekhidna lutea]
MRKAKVTTIGSSVGVVLPKEIMEKLKVEKGDTIFFVDTPNGIELTAYDVEFEEQMNAAKKVMKKYRNALRELAK